MSRFSGENFLSHSPEEVRRATFCASFFSVTEKVWLRGWWGGGGQCQDFPLKISCPTVPKNAVGEPFSHSLISGIEKVWIRGGGGGGMEYQYSLSKFFCLTMPKIFVGEPFCAVFQKYSGSEKVYGKKGVSRFSVESFLSHSAIKFRRGTLMCCVS